MRSWLHSMHRIDQFWYGYLWGIGATLIIMNLSDRWQSILMLFGVILILAGKVRAWLSERQTDQSSNDEIDEEIAMLEDRVDDNMYTARFHHGKTNAKTIVSNYACNARRHNWQIVELRRKRGDYDGGRRWLHSSVTSIRNIGRRFG